MRIKNKFLLSRGFRRNCPSPFCLGGGGGDALSWEMFGGISLVAKCLYKFLQETQKPRQSAYALHIYTLLYQRYMPSSHF